MEISKTPIFDKLLDEYYKNSTLDFVCKETGVNFDLNKEAIATYKKLKVPYPKVDSHIRLRRLRAHMGGIELFSRLDENSQKIISIYDPESSVFVVSMDHWFSDDFDATKYGVHFDTQKDFFSQWKIFSSSIPRPALVTDPNSENCSWCSYDLASKDCYATFGSVESDHILFGDMPIFSKNSVDVGNVTKTEWSYETVSCFQCSQAFFSAFCESSYNIYFCFGCRNISDCFGCYNIQNKKYCFFNEQLTKEKYEEYMKKINLGDRAVVDAYLNKKVNDLWKSSYLLASGNFNSERSIGDEVVESQDVVGISVFKNERVYNTFDTSFSKDSCDITTCSSVEKSVNCVSCTEGFENKMCISCHGCIDIEYSEHCISCEHCFACVGLRHKKFCIFNVQYSEEEYWIKLDEIKSAMFLSGEYGEFFPYSTSFFAYNTSHADTFFPLEKTEVEKLQARWYTSPKKSEDANFELLPEKLVDFDENILQKQFICPTSRRFISVVKPQLAFHKKMNVALSVEHPSIRRKKRYTLMGGLQLHRTNCVECQTEIYTRHNISTKQKIVCGQCYSKILLEDRMML
ncbi:MAG: hypothetical protein WC070_00315 [Candidatus Magasanikbacteria bacterium]